MEGDERRRPRGFFHLEAQQGEAAIPHSGSVVWIFYDVPRTLIPNLTIKAPNPINPETHIKP